MIAIIDYDAGNLTSVARALTHLGYENEITAVPETILAADQVIFPGVGAAKATMETLRQRGLDEVLTDVYRRGTPMLGICIGIQILFQHSDEEDTECLGFLPGRVRKFPTSNARDMASFSTHSTENRDIDNVDIGDMERDGMPPGTVIERLANNKNANNKNANNKVPQIGWNEVYQVQSHPIFEGIPNPAHFYFVNSYYPVPVTEEAVIGKTTYGLEFCSALAHENLIATQFHLEKSGRVGLKMLRNFVSRCSLETTKR